MWTTNMTAGLLPFDVSRSSFLLYSFIAYFVWLCVRSIYRITLHPLAKFPGPKLAAITKLYEVYWESVKGGRFSDQIERLHQQYGPIIRINPSQLHVIDPAFYDQLYNFSKHIERPKMVFDNLQHTPSYEVHRLRRKTLGNLFTRTAISRYESMIQRNVDLLCDKITKTQEKGSLVNLSVFFRCLTSDIIVELTFGEPHGFLNDPAKAKGFFEGQNTIFKNLYLLNNYKALFIFFVLTASLPESMIGPLGSQVTFIKDTMQRLKRVKEQMKVENFDKDHPKSLIEAYVTDEDLPPADKGDQQILDLGLLLYSAGFETTGFALETAFYHLLIDPSKMQRLHEEIKSAFPPSEFEPQDPLPFSKLEKLPYLTAVIEEALRMSLGVMARLPRINSHSDMTYDGFVIPKNTPVGMSQRFIHYSPDIYPEPREFKPERWLQGAESQELRKYWVPFSRGSRNCLGMNLALAEIYITMATLIHRGFVFDLHNTTRAEIDPAIDYFVPKPISDKGMWVKAGKN